jgi:hypothetical protein
MNHSASETETNYLKTVSILVFIDILACTILFLLPGPEAAYLLAGLLLHGGIGIWIGTIINWTFKVGELKNRGPVIGYWVCFGLSIISIGGPFILVQWLIAVIVVMKTSYTDHLPDDANADDFFSKIKDDPPAPDGIRKKPKGIWPLYVSLTVLLASAAAILIIAVFDTSEFGGMAMFFVHIFITPFFIIIPALLRIPAANNIKPVVIGIQMGIYLFIAFSWVVLFMRL